MYGPSHVHTHTDVHTHIHTGPLTNSDLTNVVQAAKLTAPYHNLNLPDPPRVFNYEPPPPPLSLNDPAPVPAPVAAPIVPKIVHPKKEPRDEVAPFLPRRPKRERKQRVLE